MWLLCVLSHFHGYVVDSPTWKHHECVRSGLCHSFKDVLLLTDIHKSIMTVSDPGYDTLSGMWWC